MSLRENLLFIIGRRIRWWMLGEMKCGLPWVRLFIDRLFKQWKCGIENEWNMITYRYRGRVYLWTCRNFHSTLFSHCWRVHQSWLLLESRNFWNPQALTSFKYLSRKTFRRFFCFSCRFPQLKKYKISLSFLHDFERRSPGALATAFVHKKAQNVHY